MNGVSDLELDPVYRSMEIAGERLGDIADAVYGRYFGQDGEAAELMAHMDPYTRGRMLQEVLRLLMSEDYDSETEYLRFEVKNHQQAYRVRPRMYRELLEAVRDTVAAGLTAEWDAELAMAWDARIEALVTAVDAHMDPLS